MFPQRRVLNRLLSAEDPDCFASPAFAKTGYVERSSLFVAVLRQKAL